MSNKKPLKKNKVKLESYIKKNSDSPKPIKKDEKKNEKH
jgi:hypothetical protein